MPYWSITNFVCSVTSFNSNVFVLAENREVFLMKFKGTWEDRGAKNAKKNHICITRVYLEILNRFRYLTYESEA